MYPCDGKSYTGAAILAVIKAEDADAGRTASTSNNRKTKHCVPRWVETMIDDRNRPAVAASKTQLNRRELDNHETGKKRHAVVLVFEAWKDQSVKVS